MEISMCNITYIGKQLNKTIALSIAVCSVYVTIIRVEETKRRNIVLRKNTTNLKFVISRDSNGDSRTAFLVQNVTVRTQVRVVEIEAKWTFRIVVFAF